MGVACESSFHILLYPILSHLLSSLPVSLFSFSLCSSSLSQSIVSQRPAPSAGKGYSSPLCVSLVSSLPLTISLSFDASAKRYVPLRILCSSCAFVFFFICIRRQENDASARVHFIVKYENRMENVGPFLRTKR